MTPITPSSAPSRKPSRPLRFLAWLIAHPMPPQSAEKKIIQNQDIACLSAMGTRKIRPPLVGRRSKTQGQVRCSCPVWPMATHQGELTARRLVITFVPTTVGQALPFSRLAGCGGRRMLTPAPRTAPPSPSRGAGRRIRSPRRPAKGLTRGSGGQVADNHTQRRRY
jgi:hypothetical protein